MVPSWIPAESEDCLPGTRDTDHPHSGLLAFASLRLVPVNIYLREPHCNAYSSSYWSSAEQGGYIDKWNRETEKLQATGVEKYEAFEKVSVIDSERWRRLKVRFRPGFTATRRLCMFLVCCPCKSVSDDSIPRIMANS